MLAHLATEKACQDFILNPSHALIITGPTGSGKTYLARFLARSILQTEDLDAYPYYMEIGAKAMNIEAVRTLKNFIHKKTPGKNPIRRIALLNQADSLSEAGQNALLKSIEEPPQDTVIIITSDDSTRLLPTIHSRCSSITVLPVNEMQALAHFSDTLDEAEIKKAVAVSKGYPGLLLGLLNSPDHELHGALVSAKQLLNGTSFEKLATIDKLIKGSNQIDHVLQAVEIAVKASFNKSVENTNQQTQQKLHSYLKLVHTSRQQLAAKANAKLVLTRLFLEM